MGSVGDCYDNAMIEAFWSRMQVELLNTRRWKTRVELANAIFEYIEVFHNRRRRHSSLGMLTPIEFEISNSPASGLRLELNAVLAGSMRPRLKSETTTTATQRPEPRRATPVKPGVLRRFRSRTSGSSVSSFEPSDR